MTIQERLQGLLKQKGITAYRLAKDTGIPNTDIYRILEGKLVSPRRDTTLKIARYFGVTVDFLFGEAAEPHPPVIAIEKLIPIPELGRAHAGTPTMSEEHIRSMIPAAYDPILKGQTYAIEVKGDSMIGAGINEGDILIIQVAKTARDGQRVLCAVDGGGEPPPGPGRDRGRPGFEMSATSMLWRRWRPRMRCKRPRGASRAKCLLRPRRRVAGRPRRC